MLSPNDRAAARHAHNEGQCGRFRAADDWIARSSGLTSTEALAWRHALAALRWHAEPDHGRLPQGDELAPHLEGDADERFAAALACTHAARACVLAFDVAGLDQWNQLQATLVQAGDCAVGEAWLRFHQGWSALARRQIEDAEAIAVHVLSVAADLGEPALVVDATALHALCLAELDKLDDAVAVARRGSRMARTEGMPQPEYLANFVLARMRRLAGHPHFCTRILGALLRVVPWPWYGALSWELLLSGGLHLSRTVHLSDGVRSHRAAFTLRDALAAASEGDEDAFRRRGAEAVQALGEWYPQASDIGDALTLVDALTDPCRAGTDVQQWCFGLTTSPPNAFRGLGTRWSTDSPEEATAAFVAAAGNARARRVAGLGAPLVNVDRKLPPPRGHHGRVETTIAALALAGPEGLSRADLFSTVYGFQYVHARHQGLFRVVLHRVRAELADLGTVQSEHDRYYLRLEGSLLVPDPRCDHPLEDLMLRLLARSGSNSAKTTAKELCISLRKAQIALNRLVDDGAVSIERAGRAVRYRVEDTTFQEPTRF